MAPALNTGRRISQRLAGSNPALSVIAFAPKWGGIDPQLDRWRSGLSLCFEG